MDIRAQIAALEAASGSIDCACDALAEVLMQIAPTDAERPDVADIKLIHDMAHLLHCHAMLVLRRLDDRA